MPFYDYECKECGHVMTDQLRSYAETTIKCSDCQGEAKRLFSGRFAAHGLPNGHIGVRKQRKE